MRRLNNGLWDRPTNLNNVETWNNVPVIIEKGAVNGLHSIGNEESKFRNERCFSLVGKD